MWYNNIVVKRLRFKAAEIYEVRQFLEAALMFFKAFVKVKVVISVLYINQFSHIMDLNSDGELQSQIEGFRFHRTEFDTGNV